MGTRQVSEKLDTQSRPLGSTLNQAGYIDHNKAAVSRNTDNTEVWIERRKRIVRHLWTCRGDCTYERVFPCIGKSQQSDIGE